MTTFTYLDIRTNEPIRTILFAAHVPPLPHVGATITLPEKRGAIESVHLHVGEDDHHNYVIAVA